VANGYTKLFSSIVTSTIWGESNATRIIWITLLAIADKNGEVQASIPGLARVASVPIDDCIAAIQCLLSPDKFSRTPDDEGRRIEEIPGGWHLLNHRKYRDMASKDEAVISNAERQKRYRDRLKRNADTVTKRSAIVTVRDGTVTHDRYIADADADTNAEAEAEAEAKAEGVPAVAGSPVGLKTRKPSRAPTGDHQSLIEHFTESWQVIHGHKYPFKTKDAAAVKSILESCGRNIIEAKAVVDRYLTSNDKFYEGHPLTKLNGDLPKFLAAKCNGYSKPLDRARIYSS